MLTLTNVVPYAASSVLELSLLYLNSLLMSLAIALLTQVSMNAVGYHVVCFLVVNPRHIQINLQFFTTMLSMCN